MKRRDLLGGLAAATGLGLIGCRAEPAATGIVDLRMACDPWCGYYVAAPARLIYALPLTVTGSIGIFYGKADVSELLGKLDEYLVAHA